MKKVGLMAFATNSGLGVQTKEFYDHVKPYKTLVVDISKYNGYPIYRERYEEGLVRFTEGIPSNEDLVWLLTDIDVVFVIETPLNHNLFDMAREYGVKGVLQYNYELLDYFVYTTYPKPDELWAPSIWYSYEAQMKAVEWDCKWQYVPVPVNRKVLPFKPRTRAKRFLHIAGHHATEDRNGTDIVLAAIPLVKTKNIEFIIRTQSPLEVPDDPRITLVKKEAKQYWQMFEEGDVLLLPRRYGGLTLQLNEALSTGMVPIMPDISPQNTFLDENWLVEAEFDKTIVTRPEIDIYKITPEALAKKIDQYANMHEGFFEQWSLGADRIASELSWEYLLPLYEELLNA